MWSLQWPKLNAEWNWFSNWTQYFKWRPHSNLRLSKSSLPGLSPPLGLLILVFFHCLFSCSHFIPCCLCVLHNMQIQALEIRTPLKLKAGISTFTCSKAIYWRDLISFECLEWVIFLFFGLNQLYVCIKQKRLYEKS